MARLITFFSFPRISDEVYPINPFLSVKTFQHIINYISRHYTVIPIEGVSDHYTTSKQLAVLTFDDAYYDFYINALPILDKYKLPAVEHVITQAADTEEVFWVPQLYRIIEFFYLAGLPVSISELKILSYMRTYKDFQKTALYIYNQLLHRKDSGDIIKRLDIATKVSLKHIRMMSWKHLAEASKYRMSIGSHSHTHIPLTSLNKSEIFNELQTSRYTIMQHIDGASCLSLAFPCGLYNDLSVQIAKDCGYQYLLNTTYPDAPILKHANVIERETFYHQKWGKCYFQLLKKRFIN